MVRYFISPFIFVLLSAVAMPATAQRIAQSFDKDWRFLQSDVQGAEAVAFNDASWRQLDVPHDWSIEGAYDKSNPTGRGGGYLPAGIGWYRKSFTLDDSYANRIYSGARKHNHKTATII